MLLQSPPYRTRSNSLPLHCMVMAAILQLAKEDANVSLGPYWQQRLTYALAIIERGIYKGPGLSTGVLDVK